jgi:APA family basic amino acid/polyamine antiporter
MSKSTDTAFARKASGLVRIATPFSVFAFNIFWTAFGFVLAYVFLWAPITSPGVDMGLGALITAIFVLPQVTTYAMFSVIMPRSGGDYNYVSRGLHPSLGFMVSWSWVIWLSFWAAWGSFALTWYGLAPIVTTWGAITGDKALLDLGVAMGTTEGTTAIAAVTLVIFTVLVMLGTKLYFNLQKIAFAVTLIGMVLIIVIMGTTSPSTFAHNLNAAMSSYTNTPDTYALVISKAKEAGVEFNPSFSIMPLLLLIPLFYTYMPYCMGSTFMAGEVKDIKKSQIYGGPVATIFLGIVSALLAWTYASALGNDFYRAIGYLWWNGANPLPMLPYLPAFVGIMNPNPILFLVASVAYIIWGVWFVPQNIMLNSRTMLAWGFDRIMPKKFADVSEKRHVPIFNILVVFVIALIFLALLATSPWLTLVSSIFALSIIAAFVALAAIAFPYRRRQLFEASSVKWKVGGIPVLSILGVLTLLVCLFLGYMFLTQDVLLANSPYSLYMILGIFASGFLLFFIARAYRKTQGIDVDLAYREIIPE